MGNSTSSWKLISSKSALDTLSNRMSRDNMFELRAKTSQDMHAKPHDSINSSTNSFTNGMEYNVKMKYIGVNAYGVHVYIDPLSRYLIKDGGVINPCTSRSMGEIRTRILHGRG